MKPLQRELGITFDFVTRDQEEALTMSDRITVMHDGERTANTCIDWLLDGDNGAERSNGNDYGTPNAAAEAGLDEELLAFITSPDTIGGDGSNLEEIRDTGEFGIEYSDAFMAAKA